MPDLITVLVGIVSLVLGWGLTTLGSAWTWRRQHVLDAYVEMLAELDRLSLPIGRLWGSGQDSSKRDDKWVALREVVQQHMLELDRAQGKLLLVAGQRGADAAFELYFACDREYRRAIALPPSSFDHYQEAALQTAKAYFDLVLVGRREMWLRHWREFLPWREPTFEHHKRRWDELNCSEPYPGLKREQAPSDIPE